MKKLIAVSLGAVFAVLGVCAGTVPYGYVTDGLIACWDGIDNAATGEHDGSATAWTDLVAGRQFVFKGNVSVNDDRVTFPGENTAYGEMNATDAAAIFGIASSKTVTIEIVLKSDSTSNAVVLQAPGKVGIGRYGTGTIVISTTSKSVLDWAWDAASTNTFSLTYSSADPRACFVDGEQQSYQSAGNYWSASGSLAILGNRQSYALPFNGAVYALRVYDRELSANERAANYMADKVRFQGVVDIPASAGVEEYTGETIVAPITDTPFYTVVQNDGGMQRAPILSCFR